MQNKNYYPQSDYNPETILVKDLVEMLLKFDQEQIVLFRSPQYGAFGSLTCYAVGSVSLVDLPEQTVTEPARSYEDDEGEIVDLQEETYTRPAWKGVVIE